MKPERSIRNRVAGVCCGLGVFSILGACAAAPGRADASEASTDRVSFQVERSREVANDRVRANLGVSDEDLDSAVLADRINRVMASAIEMAQSVEGVAVKSGGYRTSPVYEKGKLRRWRASQELLLESADAGVLSALAGRLQAQLQLRGLSFHVSPENRRGVEDELIIEALKAFRARAEIVRKSLGASGYTLGNIAIDTGRGSPSPRPMLMQAREMDRNVAPPAMAPGTTRVTVFVRGDIELD